MKSRMLRIELMDALASKKLGEVASSSRASRLRSRRPPAPVIAACSSAAAAPAASAAPAAAAAATERHRRTELPAGTQVKSPLVGTFYSAPSPDEPPFVLVGQEVKEGGHLCIIEAMKVMNEIKAPCSDKVVRIMVQRAIWSSTTRLLCIIE